MSSIVYLVIILRYAIDSQVGRFFIISQLCLALDVVYFYFWSEKPYIPQIRNL